MIIDCHGHYTTTPPEVGEYREKQKAAVANDPDFKGEKGTMDIRFAKQLTSFEKSAGDALKAIEERGGTAFVIKATKARVSGTTSGKLSGNLHSHQQ